MEEVQEYIVKRAGVYGLPSPALVQKICAAIKRHGGQFAPDKKMVSGREEYGYISADKVVSIIGQIMADVGISVITGAVHGTLNTVKLVRTDGGGRERELTQYVADVWIEFVVTDGESSFRSAWYAVGVDYGSPDKAIPKAMTTAHRQFIQKLFFIGQGEEDAWDTRPPDGYAVAEQQQAPVVEDNAMRLLRAESCVYNGTKLGTLNVAKLASLMSSNAPREIKDAAFSIIDWRISNATDDQLAALLNSKSQLLRDKAKAVLEKRGASVTEVGDIEALKLEGGE